MKLYQITRKDDLTLLFDNDHHPANDVLDQYAAGVLVGSDLVEFEEHLLVCEACQDRLAEVDAYREAMRSAAAELHPQLPRAGNIIPKIAWAFGLAAMALLVFGAIGWRAAQRSTLPLAIIPLQTTRGIDALPPTVAPGRAAALVLDTTGLPSFPKYNLEIVDSAGRQVVQSRAVPQRDKVQFVLSHGLPAAKYFVRIYSPSQELLREYSLAVQR